MGNSTRGPRPAAIDHDRHRHEGELLRPEPHDFRPGRLYDTAMRPTQGFLRSFREFGAAERTPEVLSRLGIVADNLRAAENELRGDREGPGLPHIVRPRLEGEPEE